MRAGANVVNGANAGAGKAKPDFPTKTHERSGYQWNRAEDEPGYAWLNKKAMDEYHRAADGLVHKDSMILGMFVVDCLCLGFRDSKVLTTLCRAVWRSV